jgi:hypothetical protein
MHAGVGGMVAGVWDGVFWCSVWRDGGGYGVDAGVD